MISRWIQAGLGAFSLVLLAAPCVLAQTPAPTPSPSNQAAPQLAPEQLEQLLAPIALYPDPLLAQILMAATYPLEVVEADRWLQAPQNAALKGDALAAALEQQDWDPSVKSLVPFPRILQMMDNELDWTERLGEAFLADQAAVMDAVQRLRSRAQASGHLATSPQAVVTPEEEAITIEPPSLTPVYYPICDPSIVYGSWPYPAYSPYYFPGNFDATVAGGFGCGWIGTPIVSGLWGWHRWNWRGHRIYIDRRRYTELNRNVPPTGGEAWEHETSHRRAVPYQNPIARERFSGSATTPEAANRARGYPAVPALQPYNAPRPAPPTFESFGRGAEVRTQAVRGNTSRMSAPTFAPHAVSPPRIAPSGGGGMRR